MSAAPVPAPVVSAPAQDTPAAAPQELGHKVFVGNLAYVTTDEGLKEFFAPVAGDILSVQVIQRGTRSAGYGFVSLSTVAAVEKAVAELDRKDLEGRTVIVESAKPAEAKDKERTEKRSKKRAGRRNGKAVNGEVTDAEANGEAEKSADAPAAAAATATDGAEGEQKPKKAKKPRKPRAKKTATEGAPAEGEVATDAAAATPAAATEGEAAPKKAKKPRAPRAERQPRAEGEEPTGEPSKSVVFVANLAFNVDDAALAELFTAEGIEVVSARVVRRRFGQPRRSKGYGFVDVGNEVQQKKAVELFQGKEVAGREIAVKIAVSAPAAEAEAAEEAAAAARAASPETEVVAK